MVRPVKVILALWLQNTTALIRETARDQAGAGDRRGAGDNNKGYLKCWVGEPMVRLPATMMLSASKATTGREGSSRNMREPSTISHVSWTAALPSGSSGRSKRTKSPQTTVTLEKEPLAPGISVWFGHVARLLHRFHPADAPATKCWGLCGSNDDELGVAITTV